MRRQAGIGESLNEYSRVPTVGTRWLRGTRCCRSGSSTCSRTPRRRSTRWTSQSTRAIARWRPTAHRSAGEFCSAACTVRCSASDATLRNRCENAHERANARAARLGSGRIGQQRWAAHCGLRTVGCALHCRYHIRGLPPIPENEARVKLIFSMDVSGLLKALVASDLLSAP